MKYIECARDRLECDLNKQSKSCRHLTGMFKDGAMVPGWQGKCEDRLVKKR